MWMRRFSIVIALIAAGMPLAAAYAAVVVNEVAWMGSSNGTSSSANASDEWIELATRGTEAVDLAGWTLSISGSAIIKLGKSIAPGSYYLIERTDDNAVPGIQADLVASFGRGGLSNKGETLVLRDAAGVVEDTVIGGANWVNIGGSASSKNTPQRQADGSWFTSHPTPRAQNAVRPTPAPQPREAALAVTSASSIAPKAVAPAPVLPQIPAKQRARSRSVAAQPWVPEASSSAATASTVVASSAAIPQSVGEKGTSFWLWIGCLAAVIGAGIAGILSLPKRELADEFEIIEVPGRSEE